MPNEEEEEKKSASVRVEVSMRLFGELSKKLSNNVLFKNFRGLKMAGVVL